MLISFQPVSLARPLTASRNFSFRVHGHNTNAKHGSSQEVRTQPDLPEELFIDVMDAICCY